MCGKFSSPGPHPRYFWLGWGFRDELVFQLRLFFRKFCPWVLLYGVLLGKWRRQRRRVGSRKDFSFFPPFFTAANHLSISSCGRGPVPEVAFYRR